jgi:poly-D-alanine transfer protein DltD
MYTRLSEAKNYKNVDILFLGSSHSYRGFDPRIFAQHNYKTFNLGSSAQTPLQTKVLLERYIKNLNPKKVVYEVFPRSFTTDGVESSLDIIANAHNDKYSLKMAMEVNHIKTYNTLLYASIRQALNLDKAFVEPKIREKDQYISGGFVQKQIHYFKPRAFKKKKIKIKDNQLDAFSEIIETLNNRNVEVILVFAPITTSKYSQYNNISTFDSIMNEYSTYYNFNKTTLLNDSLHFYDPHHLNLRGVKLFNERLIDSLDKN